MRGQEPAPLQLRLQPRHEQVSLVRERVRACLEDAGANEREIFEVLLATTEAFTNAVEHPQAPKCQVVDLECSINNDAVIVSIRDYGTWQPKHTTKDTGGLGLVIIEVLADTFQVKSMDDGTKVIIRRQLAKR